MGLAHYLFGLSGRINRAKQWAVFFVSFVHYILLTFAFAFTIGFGVFADLYNRTTTLTTVIGSPQARTFAIIFCALSAIGFYIGIAVAIKRLHDRDRSAWWVIVFFILPFVLNIPALLHLPVMFAYMGDVMRATQAHLPPPPQPFEPPLVVLSRGAASILGLWAFVELYILRGTVGDNRFGPDPLAGRG